MKSLLSAVALALLAGAAPAAEATARIAVTGLTCPSCSYIVATAMKRVESVEILSFTEAGDDAGVYDLAAVEAFMASTPTR